jgi:tetratricopeptide (TPR) repeat protein
MLQCKKSMNVGNGWKRTGRCVVRFPGRTVRDGRRAEAPCGERLANGSAGTGYPSRFVHVIISPHGQGSAMFGCAMSRVLKSGLLAGWIAALLTVVSASPVVAQSDQIEAIQDIEDRAISRFSAARYAEAEPLFRRVLAARERLLGPNHEDTLVAVRNLGGLYIAQQRYAEAVPYYRRMLAASERTFGREDLRTLAALYELGRLHQSLGNYAEGEPLYRRMLELYERRLGREHLRTYLILNDLGLLYQSWGRYNEAEPIYRRALDMSGRVSEPDHPRTLAVMNNLSTLLISQRRYTEAEQLARQSLAAAERRLGPDAPETLTAANNLAVSLQEQGRLPEAETLLLRILNTRQRIQGLRNADTIVASANLTTLRRLSSERSQPRSSSAAANGSSCMIVTDIAIIDGQEARVPKQLCRTPPSTRWVRT